LGSVDEEPEAMRKTLGPSQVSNIKVAVRLRPINQNEIEEGQFEIVQIVDQKVSNLFNNQFLPYSSLF
jgi:hypothetical protein